MQTAATSQQSPSPSAVRMRRARERRRQGGSIVSLEVGSGAIANLIALGWLSEPEHGNRGAITYALVEMIKWAIQARVTSPSGSQDQLCFMCEIQRSTIQTLITLGWLNADDQDDLAAIVRAFRRFVGRAIGVARNGGHDRWYLP
jgi:hypothetical protein